MRLKTWAGPTVVGVLGLTAAAALAATDGMRPADSMILVRDSVLGSVAVGVLAVIGLTLARRARLGVQIAAAAAAPVVAVGVGVMWASWSMFLTRDDLNSLWVVLVSAATVGTICAWFLGRRVAVASRKVGQLAQTLGDGDADMPAGSSGRGRSLRLGNEPGELARLADELRATSARLSEARQEAVATEKARRDLVAWVSHDLRTPLSGIQLMAEALQDRLVEDDETVTRYYATIRTEADRLSGLVDDLFELSRLQAGSVRLDRTVTVLDDLVADAVDAAAAAARTDRVDLRHVRPSTPVRTAVDVAAVTRVVRNLVDNAIRHTPAGGVVTVRTEIVDFPQPTAVVKVSDECGGIPERDLARLFEVGYRGDSARTPGPTGGGFGLAIARGLIEAHQGEISVENVGEGCCFQLRLPASSERARSDRPAEGVR